MVRNSLKVLHTKKGDKFLKIKNQQYYSEEKINTTNIDKNITNDVKNRDVILDKISADRNVDVTNILIDNDKITEEIA